ncbi:alpha-(1,3)-fucosyltransferase C-like [Neodiprion pinetum]|uniref:alpha-(1,3)-fucosyltransferase C-like n=1 Tax=Neodiprion pinetum TaxID=441929 RepID=UPI001EDE069A|nr:alpha-(1,3)-fucosyltransferase C-like [Neodiprion pinetum]
MSLNRRVSVKLYLLILLISVPVIIFWILGRHISETRSCDKEVRFSHHQEERLVDRAASSVHETNTKTILYWTKMWESDNMDFGDGDIFASCAVWKCVATNNRTALNVQDFDMIIFHALDIKANDLPQQRSPHQRYVFLNLETQVFHPIPDNQIYRNFFNWTMTYRRDSTLMRPYGVVKVTDLMEYVPPHIPVAWRNVSEGTIPEETRRKVQGKTKMVSWFVSNCFTSSKRELYVQALKQHIPVDIFGDCGSLKCDQEETDCFEMVERDYYFYLAMENSLCRDYITEKAFKFLRYNVVPVVYGAADYASVLPPGSYIDIQDFSSPEALADYLWVVSQNPERYLNFFKWKNYYNVELRPEHYTVCKLCKKLHEVAQSPMIIDDIYGWWTTDQCLREPSFQGIP